MKTWKIVDTYKDWTLEQHTENGKFRVKWKKKVWTQFVATDGSNGERAKHYFNHTVKVLF